MRLPSLDRLLITLGLGLCCVYFVAKMHAMIGSRAALAAFSAIQSTPSANMADPMDFSLWSEKRIAAYKTALVQRFEPPIAILNVPRFQLVVPVFNGTDDVILNRAVGRIIGTAKPGEEGNIGIAGHRDGFFRALKDIALGDRVALESGGITRTYIVQETLIVTPDDVSVLGKRDVPTLTLVTCYPFYFVGDAPQRFIIRCTPDRCQSDTSLPESPTTHHQMNN